MNIQFSPKKGMGLKRVGMRVIGFGGVVGVEGVKVEGVEVGGGGG